MIILSAVLFLLTIYGYYGLFKKNDSEPNFYEIFDDTKSILMCLNYYNVNINSIKIELINNCMIYLLELTEPNCKNYNLEIYDLNDKNDFNTMIDNFEKYCVSLNKIKYDLTVNEIKNFIKTQIFYKKREKMLNLFFARAIILSKYLNDETIDDLVDVLNERELQILERSFYQPIFKFA